MGNDRSRNRYQGLGMPDRRLDSSGAIWDAQTTAQQAGPRPGVPVPQQAETALVVSAGGVMASTDAIDLRVVRGGLVGAGQGSWGWRRRGATPYYGWDHPGLVTHTEGIKWGTTTGDDHEDVDVCTTAAGTVIVVAAVPGVGSFTLRAYRRTMGSTTWATVTIATGLTVRPRAGVCSMPDGSDQVWYWVADAGNTAQIRVERSVDDGATWAATATGALDVPIDTSGTAGAGAAGFDLGRIRVAVANGQTLLLAHIIAHNTTPTFRSSVVQAAGPGNGEALINVSINGGTSFWGFPTIAVLNGQFIAGIHGGPVDNEIRLYRLASALTPIDSAGGLATPARGGFEPGFFDGTAKFQIGGVAELVVDDVGALYHLIQVDNSDAALAGAVLISRTRDNAATWEPLGTFPAPLSGTIQQSALVNIADAGTRINALGATFRAGQLVLAATHESTGTTLDESLLALYAGGHSTLTVPGLDAFAALSRRASWSRIGLPLDLPDAVGWTLTTAGTASAAISTSEPRLRISTTSGTQAYDVRPPGAVAESLISRVAMRLDGTPLGVVTAGFRQADGTTEHEIEIHLGASSTIIRDIPSGAALATISLPGAVAREYLVSMRAGRATVAFRTYSNDIDRTWTIAVAGATLTAAGSPSSDNRVIFGNIGVTAVSDWYEWHLVSDAEAGRGFSQGFANPADLIGRDWAPPPHAAKISTGTTIGAMRGPGRVNDEWRIDPRYRYGIDSAFWREAPAARIGWRSVNTTAQAIALQLTTNGRPRIMSDTALFTLIGVNFSQFEISGWDGSAWQSLATVDTRLPAGVLVGSGDTLVSSSSVGSTTYLDAGEYAGACVEWGSNVYRIRDHSAGVLGTTGTARMAEIVVDGLDTATASQDGAIIPRDVAVRVDLLGVHYSAWRIGIASQPTPEGYHEIGLLHVGRVEVFGTPPAFGWQTSTATNTTSETSPDGTTRTARRGDAQRQYVQAWTDGVWMGQHDNGVGSPDFLLLNANGNAEPSGTKHDTGAQVEGLLREVDGADRPVVVLRTVDRLDGATVQVYNRRAQFMLARLSGEVSVENVRGPEYASELVRIAQLVADEVV